MIVKHPVCKAVFRISLIQRYAVFFFARTDSSRLHQCITYYIHIIGTVGFDKNIHNVFCGYILNGCTADMTDNNGNVVGDKV